MTGFCASLYKYELFGHNFGGAVEFGAFLLHLQQHPNPNHFCLERWEIGIRVEFFFNIYNLEISRFLKDSPGSGALMLLFINLKTRWKYSKLDTAPPALCLASFRGQKVCGVKASFNQRS